MEVSSSRKLIGMLGLIAYLTVYCIAVIAVTATWMTDQNILIQTIFYVIAGLAWLPPARWLLYWMNGVVRDSRGA
ncbi:MAG: DUF2842 domain-containing protein [Pseudomonadota bacterium]